MSVFRPRRYTAKNMRGKQIFYFFYVAVVVRYYFKYFLRNPNAAGNLQFGKICRGLNKNKASLFPSAPLTAAAVKSAFEEPIVMNRFGMSLDAVEPTVFYNGTVIEAGFKFTVFSSAKNIAKRRAMTVRNYHVDATFKVVPNGEYSQLLVVHLAHEEHAFPLVYILMTGKTQESYTRVFQYIEDNVCQLEPTSFMSDYERGMRNAIRMVYPNCTVYGCWFHYCQAIRKRSSQIPRFNGFLKGNTDARKLFHKFLALPLVRLDLIPATFNRLKQLAEAAIFGAAFKEFVKYFERYWMRIETPDSFCVFLKVSRTNNLVESHNSQLRRQIGSKGNFFKFVEKLQADENAKSLEMSQVLDGALQVYPNQRNKMKIRNDKIRKLQNKLSLGEISAEVFLNRITCFGNSLMED